MSKITKELKKKISQHLVGKYFPIFARQAMYMGNGIYSIGRLHSTNTQELFLMFIADMEDIDYEGKVEETEDEVE